MIKYLKWLALLASLVCLASCLRVFSLPFGQLKSYHSFCGAFALCTSLMYGKLAIVEHGRTLAIIATFLWFFVALNELGKLL